MMLERHAQAMRRKEGSESYVVVVPRSSGQVVPVYAPIGDFYVQLR